MVLPAVRDLVQHCTGTLGPNGEAALNDDQSATLERKSRLHPASLNSQKNWVTQDWDNFIHTTVLRKGDGGPQNGRGMIGERILGFRT